MENPKSSWKKSWNVMEFRMDKRVRSLTKDLSPWVKSPVPSLHVIIQLYPTCYPLTAQDAVNFNCETSENIGVSYLVNQFLSKPTGIFPVLTKGERKVKEQLDLLTCLKVCRFFCTAVFWCNVGNRLTQGAGIASNLSFNVFLALKFCICILSWTTSAA